MKITTFGQAGKEFLAFRATKKAVRTATKHAWLLDTLKPLHNRQLVDIAAPDVMKVLRSLEGKGKAETARRAGQFCGRVFRHAVREGYCTHNPATDLRGGLEGVVVTSRPGYTDPEKFGRMMLLLDMPGYSHHTVYNALRLIARTALRPGELRQGLWSEIDWDKAEWRVPATRKGHKAHGMKMKREHLVPLSTQALEILRDQQQTDLGPSDYIFPGLRPGRPISDAAMGLSLRNMFIPPKEHCCHGFRVSFSSMMNEAGEDPAVVELCLAHAKKDKIAGIYDRSQRNADRRKLMQSWADLIDTLKRKAL